MARRVESALQVRVRARRRRAVEGVERGEERLQEHLGRVLPPSRPPGPSPPRSSKCRKRRWRYLETRPGSRVCRGCLGKCKSAWLPRLLPCILRLLHDQAQHAENPPPDVNGEHGTLPEENRTLLRANGTHLPSVMKSAQLHALMVFGWQIMKSRTKQKSHSDMDLHRSAAIMGYAAQASLSTGSTLECRQHHVTGSQLTEYPLFLECQDNDSNRASFTIYLLRIRIQSSFFTTLVWTARVW